MAGKTIEQRIALAGGREIKDQLDGIGAAGKKAFQSLNDAAKASPAIQNLSATFDAIKKKAAEIGGAFGELGGSISTLGTRIATMARNMSLMIAAIAGAVVGIALLFKNSANATDELGDMAEALQLTVKQFQELSFAFGQTGVSQDKFIRGMVKFNKALDESGKADADFEKKQNALNRQLSLGRITVEEYNKQLTEARFEASQVDNIFSKLGITVERNADGTTNNVKALEDLAEAFKTGLPEGISKSTVALQLFGKGSQNMVERLNEGREGFVRSRLEMERLAPPMDRLAVAAGDRLSRAFETLGRAEESARNAALAVFFPLVTRVVNALTEAIAENRTALIAFASDIASRITPIVDDLIAVLQGRDADVKNGFILQARDNVVALGAALQHAVINIIIPALKLMLATLEVVAQAMNGLFGTELTGGQLAAALVITRVIGLFGVLRASISVVIALVRLLTISFGLVPLAIAAIGFAIGFFIVQAIQQLGGLTGIWTTVWTAIQGMVLGVFNRIVAGLTAVGAFFVSIWNGALTAVQTVFAAIVAVATAAFDSVVAAFNALPAALQAIFTTLVQMALLVWNGIIEGARAVGAGIVSAFRTAVDSVAGFFSSLRDSIFSIFDSIIEAAKKVANAIASAMGSGDGPGLAQGGQGFARGGRVWGAGTSTSDSIPARLSRGEFVEPTKSVRKYGLRFMEAIRRGLLSVDAVRSLMNGQGFNMGGLADSLGSIMPRVPHYANGGLVGAAISGGGGRPLTLVIDGESIRGLTADGDAEAQLLRISSKRSIRSAGRKPSYVS